MIFKKENDELLATIAVKNNLDMDEVISAYLICGNSFLMLMNVFEGREVKFPSKRRLTSPSLHNVKFIEDDCRKYADYERGDVITVGDDDFEVISKEKKVLNHYYVPVTKIED